MGEVKTKKEKNTTDQELATLSKSQKKVDSEQNSDIAKQSEIVVNESKMKGLFEASVTFETADPPDRRRRNFYPGPNKHGLSVMLLIILITMATIIQLDIVSLGILTRLKLKRTLNAKRKRTYW